MWRFPYCMHFTDTIESLWPVRVRSLLRIFYVDNSIGAGKVCFYFHNDLTLDIVLLGILLHPLQNELKKITVCVTASAGNISILEKFNLFFSLVISHLKRISFLQHVTLCYWVVPVPRAMLGSVEMLKVCSSASICFYQALDIC